MYCKKCKKNANLFDKYCKVCGSKLELKIVDSIKIKKIARIVIISLMLLFLIFVGFQTAKYFISPEYTAQKYFKAVINNDIDKIYGYLDTQDSEFVSKTILTEKMDFFETINDYKIVSTKQYNDYILVKISYITNDGSNEIYVKLVKTNNILKPYKVISGKIANNITFKVPHDAKIIIDEKELTDYSTKDNIDIYNIDTMIKGTYNVKITINDIILEEEITVENNSIYTISSVDLNANLEENLISKTKENLNYIYNNIIAGKTFDDIKEHFVVATNKLKSSYNSIKRTINSNITNIEIIDLEIKKATYSNNGKLLITYLADQNVTTSEKTVLYTRYIQVEYDYINNTYEVYNISR